ncbi:sulfur carrier protein ThiS [Bartonella sp. DGB2]|uniref:sulfur carrier protein ThiS n=1 Tax=Bartonella sp. DGB2 TaxID=3388426 RepID=UPI00398FA1F6
MIIYVNGEAVSYNGTNLQTLLNQLEYKGDWLATAVNGQLVRAEERSNQLLNHGDKIEVLSPMQGG